jgi:hypothetical protein
LSGQFHRLFCTKGPESPHNAASMPHLEQHQPLSHARVPTHAPVTAQPLKRCYNDVVVPGQLVRRWAHRLCRTATCSNAHTSAGIINSRIRARNQLNKLASCAGCTVILRWCSTSAARPVAVQTEPHSLCKSLCSEIRWRGGPHVHVCTLQLPQCCLQPNRNRLTLSQTKPQNHKLSEAYGGTQTELCHVQRGQPAVLHTAAAMLPHQYGSSEIGVCFSHATAMRIVYTPSAAASVTNSHCSTQHQLMHTLISNGTTTSKETCPCFAILPCKVSPDYAHLQQDKAASLRQTYLLLRCCCSP